MFDVEFDEEDSVCVVISFVGVNVGFDEVGLEVGAFVKILNNLKIMF